METFVVRLWLPDRPGALGQVASRIGAVRGDVLGIEILERDGGQAVDELVVELPDASLVEPLARELRQVEGVGVEEIRPLGETGRHHDPCLDALEAVAQLVGAADEVQLLDGLVAAMRRVVDATWAAVVDLDRDGQGVVARAGDAPSAAWLQAFAGGSADALSGEPSDAAWAPLPSAGMALIVGRDEVAFRARERREVAAFARVADTRRRELIRTASRSRHPSIRN